MVADDDDDDVDDHDCLSSGLQYRDLQQCLSVNTPDWSRPVNILLTRNCFPSVHHKPNSIRANE